MISFFGFESCKVATLYCKDVDAGPGYLSDWFWERLVDKWLVQKPMPLFLRPEIQADIPMVT